MVTPGSAIDANAVIDRMRQLLDVATDVALCAALDRGTSQVSTWRRRNSVPYAECVDLSVRTGASLDWLLLGLGPMRPDVMAHPGAPGTPPEDPRVARMVAFIRRWQASRDPDEMAWLERTLARNVPEYSQWLADQAATGSRATVERQENGETLK